MNIYQKCEDCRGYINTLTTCHVIVRGVDSAEVYLHQRPCYQRYAECNEHEVVKKVCDKKRS